MDRELLMKFFQVSDFVTKEIKEQRRSDKGDPYKKDEHHHSNKDKNHHEDDHKHSHKHRDKLSLTAKNTLRILLTEDNINQRTISKKLNVTAQAMSETIKKLVDRGYVVKTNNKTNNENIITLTLEGREKAVFIDSLLNKVSENVFSMLTDEEKSNLVAILDKIYMEDSDESN